MTCSFRVSSWPYGGSQGKPKGVNSFLGFETAASGLYGGNCRQFGGDILWRVRRNIQLDKGHQARAEIGPAARAVDEAGCSQKSAGVFAQGRQAFAGRQAGGD